MNVRNEPVHVMACVVKREILICFFFHLHMGGVLRFTTQAFQNGKSISESRINNFGGRGLLRNATEWKNRTMAEHTFSET